MAMVMVEIEMEMEMETGSETMAVVDGFFCVATLVVVAELAVCFVPFTKSLMSLLCTIVTTPSLFLRCCTCSVKVCACIVML